jgi:hypothetical protein
MIIVIFCDGYHGTEVVGNNVRIRRSRKKCHEHEGKGNGREGKGGEEA